MSKNVPEIAKILALGWLLAAPLQAQVPDHWGAGSPAPEQAPDSRRLSRPEAYRDKGDRYRAAGRDVKLLRNTQKWVFVYRREPSDTASFRGRMRGRMAARSLGGSLEDRQGPGSRRLRVLSLPDSADADALPSQARDLARAEGGGTYARPVYLDPERGSEFTVSDRLLVKTRGPLSDAARKALADAVSADVADTRAGNVLILQLRNAESDLFAAAAKLAARADVAWAEPEILFQPRQFFLPNDTYFGRQQHLRNTGQNGALSGADVNAAEAWDITRGDTSIVIAVLDDGVQAIHPDLRFAPGGRNYFADPVTSDGNPTSGLDMHGTAVAGVAAARGNNGVGVSGMAPNARILPIKIFQATAFTTYTAAGDAIRYAADAGADVISNSWGGGAPSTYFTDAVVYASTQGRGGKGAPVFFATGNSGDLFANKSLLFGGAGTYYVEFVYKKNASGTAGLDMVAVDNVSVLNADGYTVALSESFSGGALPAGWSVFGNQLWSATNTTYQPGLGDTYSMRSGAIADSDSTRLRMPLRAFTTGQRLNFKLRTSTAAGDNFILRLYNSSNVLVFSTLTTSGISASTPTIAYPASADSAIAVGASTDFDYRAGYSQFDTLGTAKSVDFVAPSNGGWSSVTTTDRSGTGVDTGYTPLSDYTYGFSGTSSATPVAAGIAALMLSKNPGLTRNQVLSLMRSSAAKIGSRPYVSGYNTEYGYGRLDAEAALNATPQPTPVIAYATPQVYAAGAAISTLTPASTGGTPDSWSVTPALPGGLALNSGTGVITGTPLLSSAAANYAVIAQNSSGADTATLNITVTLQKPTTLHYALETATYGRNVAIATNAATVGGGTEFLGFSILSGALPDGLALNASTGAITGKPTVAGVFTPTIRVANDSGFADRPLNLTVNGFIYGTASAAYPQLVSIATNSPGTVIGNDGAYSVNPALPDGLSLNTENGAITGTPTTTQPLAKYAVTRDFSGASAADTIAIAVLPTPPATLAYAQNPSRYTKGVGIILSRPSLTGGTESLTFAVQSGALPAGISLSPVTGNIFGAPSVSGNFSPVIRVSNGGGYAEATLSISVADSAPLPTYTPDTVSYPLAQAIATLAPANGGGNVQSWSIAPNLAAQTGLSFNTTTGKITGTPLYVHAATDYTVTATGYGGVQGQTVIRLATTPAPPSIGYPGGSHAYPLAQEIATLAPANTGAPVTQWSITPDITARTGLLFSTKTGKILGTPVYVSADTAYTVIATSLGGAADTAVVNVSTTAPAPTVSYPDALQEYPLGVAISPLNKTGAGGVISGYSIAPALPAGLVLNPTTGRIQGTPSVATAAADYIVSAHGPGGTGKDTVHIATITPAPTVSYPDAPIALPVGVAITPLAKNGTSGIITGFSIAPNLNALTGLVFNTTTGLISGTPLYAAPATDYVITAHGPGGNGSDVVNLATTSNAPLLSFAGSPYSFVKGSPIPVFRADNAGGRISGWALGTGSNGKSLTANTGLLFNPTTGKFEGTPVYLSAAVNYTVTAFGLAGSQNQAVVSIAVTPIAKAGARTADAFSFRVTGVLAGYVLRLPPINETTERLIVSITSLSGRRVWQKIIDPREGARELIWDGRDPQGQLVASGMYLVSVAAMNQRETIRTIQKAITMDR